jgi:protein-L-isoaspartate(D-aspartate) O-methyltransferase
VNRPPSKPGSLPANAPGKASTATGEPRGPRFPLGLDRVHTSPGTPPPASAALQRPQRPVQQAAADTRRLQPATGVGLDSAAVRTRMVSRLQAGGLRCEPVLRAFAAVHRHRFVDTALAAQAYEDTSLPIGLQQTISKPSVVGRMLSLLFEGAGAKARGHLGRVLEVGTGCGYQTALLAHLTTQVVSIERLQPLHERARVHLQQQQPDLPPRADLRLLHGDGRLGHPPRAPYDAIIAAAGGEAVPEAWLAQLADGGRLVAPVHDAAQGSQVLVVVDRQGETLHRWCHEAVHFVPLKSGLG